MLVTELLDRAKTAGNLPSDNQLAAHLGVSQAAVWTWRKGRGFPTAEHTRKLAEIAGIHQQKAVLEMLERTTKDEKLKRTFSAIRRAVPSLFGLTTALAQAARHATNCILC